MEVNTRPEQGLRVGQNQVLCTGVGVANVKKLESQQEKLYNTKNDFKTIIGLGRRKSKAGERGRVFL